jgi:hypothetical protein
MCHTVCSPSARCQSVHLVAQLRAVQHTAASPRAKGVLSGGINTRPLVAGYPRSGSRSALDPGALR